MKYWHSLWLKSELKFHVFNEKFEFFLFSIDFKSLHMNSLMFNRSTCLKRAYRRLYSLIVDKKPTKNSKIHPCISQSFKTCVFIQANPPITIEHNFFLRIFNKSVLFIKIPEQIFLAFFSSITGSIKKDNIKYFS